MLVIRAEQLLEFQRGQVDRFEWELSVMLRNEFPSMAALPPDELISIVRAGRWRAPSFAIFRRQDIIRFVWLIGKHGPDIGETPVTAWAGPILRRPDRSGSEKLAALEAWEGNPDEKT
ncbi:MAG: hypothetical protein JWQ98_1655 [Chlorobi bacterium]|nr:hypothetical protein [Chlorobiota bacterium]